MNTRSSIALLIVLVLCGCTSRVQTPEQSLEHGASAKSLQQKCLEYQPPADTVVYDATDNAKLLLAQNTGYEAIFLKPGHPDFAAKLPSPAGFVPPPWRELYGTLAKGRSSDATLFIGIRHSPSGHERMICMDLVSYQKPARTRTTYCRTMIIEPESKTSGPRLIGIGSRHEEGVPQNLIKDFGWQTYETPYNYRRAWSAQIFAGQPDPRDGSHLVIRCRNDDLATYLHGFLTDDDQVDLVLTHNPTMTRAEYDTTFKK